nr:hypothetical protein [Tanacetum cinerariifolium]GEY49034.1 hypothetical protein [Tanacetum cinerariifolium]
MARRPLHWKVIQDVNHKKSSNGDFIMVEDDHDVIHENNSSDLAFSASLNDLDFITLNIDSQSTKVKAQPPVVPVDDDDDLINDKDEVFRDLADSDEVIANSDYDGDEVATIMSVAIKRGHSSDDGSGPPPSSRQKATREGMGGGRDGGKKGVHKATRNMKLKRAMKRYCPQQIKFEWKDKK